MYKIIILLALVFSFSFITPLSAQDSPADEITSSAIPPLQTMASPTSASDEGVTVRDPKFGVQFKAPNENWSVTTTKHSVGLNHNVLYDVSVILKKSWYTVSSIQEAYNKRKDSLINYLPGAIFVKENDEVTLGGTTKGLSMIYKNPGKDVVKREIMFIHKNQAYELVFQAKDENFQKVKTDFSYILNNMVLF